MMCQDQKKGKEKENKLVKDNLFLLFYLSFYFINSLVVKRDNKNLFAFFTNWSELRGTVKIFRFLFTIHFNYFTDNIIYWWIYFLYNVCYILSDLGLHTCQHVQCCYKHWLMVFGLYCTPPYRTFAKYCTKSRNMQLKQDYVQLWEMFTQQVLCLRLWSWAVN